MQSSLFIALLIFVVGSNCSQIYSANERNDEPIEMKRVIFILFLIFSSETRGFLDLMCFHCDNIACESGKIICPNLEQNINPFSTCIKENSKVKRIKIDGSCSPKVLPDKIAEENFPSLRELDISWNELTSIRNWQNELPITALYAMHNELNKIQETFFDKTPNITRVNLSFNKITVLKATDFHKTPNLAVLNVANNSISVVETGAFAKCGKLKHLNLANNPLKSFSFKEVFPAMPSVASIEVHLPSASIETLDVSCESSACVFQSFTHENNFENIKSFNASGNQLKNISSVLHKLGPKLETLDLSGSFIGSMDSNTFIKFDQLKHLRLSNAGLSNVGTDSFYFHTKLVSLDLSHNQLTEVDSTLFGKKFQHLTHMNLEGNQLTKIDNITVLNFPNLASLAISNNHFSCEYLEKYNNDTLKQWQGKLLLVRNNDSADQNHVNGIDCLETAEWMPITVIIGVVLGSVVLCFILAAVIWYVLRKWSKNTMAQDKQSEMEPNQHTQLEMEPTYDYAVCSYDNQEHINHNQSQNPYSNLPVQRSATPNQPIALF